MVGASSSHYEDADRDLRVELTGLTAVFIYLNHICRQGTTLLCPYRVVYLPENSCKHKLRIKTIVMLGAITNQCEPKSRC